MGRESLPTEDVRSRRLIRQARAATGSLYVREALKNLGGVQHRELSDVPPIPIKSIGSLALARQANVEQITPMGEEEQEAEIYQFPVRQQPESPNSAA